MLTERSRRVAFWTITVFSCYVIRGSTSDDLAAQAGTQRKETSNYRYLKKFLVDSLERQSNLLSKVKNLVGNRSLASKCECDVTIPRCESEYTGSSGPSSATREPDGNEAGDWTSQFLSRIAAAESTAKDALIRLSQPLRIVLVGPVSHGKSLIMNCMLRQDVLPSTVGPVSYLSVVVKGTDESQPYTLMPDGQRLPLDDLVKHIDIFDRPGNHEDTTPDIHSTISLLWPHKKCPVLAGDIEVWDTPGFDYSEETNDVIRQQCTHGDVIVAVVDSMMGLPLSFTKFLRSFDHARLLLAFTKWDEFRVRVHSSIPSDHRVAITRQVYKQRADSLVFNNHGNTDHHDDNNDNKVFFVDSLSYWRDVVMGYCGDDNRNGQSLASHDCIDAIHNNQSRLGTLSEGVQGFIAMETALHTMAARNGVKTKLLSGWKAATELTQVTDSTAHDFCSHVIGMLTLKKRATDSCHEQLGNLPSLQRDTLDRIDNFYKSLYRWKLELLSSVMGEAATMEKDMIDGGDKEMAVRRHLLLLNTRLESEDLVPERLVHEVNVQRTALLEGIPLAVKNTVAVLLRQSNERLTLKFIDCALADFQSSPGIVMMYASLRAGSVVLLAYVAVLFLPFRHIGSIILSFALLHVILTAMYFDPDVERTKRLVSHIESSLQHGTQRRLSNTLEQSRDHLSAEVLSQYSALRTELDGDTHRMLKQITCLESVHTACHSLQHDLSLLMDNIVAVHQLIEDPG